MRNCKKAIAPLFILFLLVVGSTPCMSQSQPTKVIVVSAGSFHSAALCDDGTVWTWGDNGYGQLGDGTNKSSYAPVQVTGLSHVKAIAAGSGHMLALKEDGTVWAWGRGFRGELGIDSVNPTRDSQDI